MIALDFTLHRVLCDPITYSGFFSDDDCGRHIPDGASFAVCWTRVPRARQSTINPAHIRSQGSSEYSFFRENGRDMALTFANAVGEVFMNGESEVISFQLKPNRYSGNDLPVIAKGTLDAVPYFGRPRKTYAIKLRDALGQEIGRLLFSLEVREMEVEEETCLDAQPAMKVPPRSCVAGPSTSILTSSNNNNNNISGSSSGLASARRSTNAESSGLPARTAARVAFADEVSSPRQLPARPATNAAAIATSSSSSSNTATAIPDAAQHLPTITLDLRLARVYLPPPHAMSFDGNATYTLRIVFGDALRHVLTCTSVEEDELRLGHHSVPSFVVREGCTDKIRFELLEDQLRVASFSLDPAKLRSGAADVWRECSIPFTYQPAKQSTMLDLSVRRRDGASASASSATTHQKGSNVPPAHDVRGSTKEWEMMERIATSDDAELRQLTSRALQPPPPAPHSIAVAAPSTNYTSNATSLAWNSPRANAARERTTTTTTTMMVPSSSTTPRQFVAPPPLPTSTTPRATTTSSSTTTAAGATSMPYNNTTSSNNNTNNTNVHARRRDAPTKSSNATLEEAYPSHLLPLAASPSLGLPESVPPRQDSSPLRKAAVAPTGFGTFLTTATPPPPNTGASPRAPPPSSYNNNNNTYRAPPPSHTAATTPRASSITTTPRTMPPPPPPPPTSSATTSLPTQRYQHPGHTATSTPVRSRPTATTSYGNTTSVERSSAPRASSATRPHYSEDVGRSPHPVAPSHTLRHEEMPSRFLRGASVDISSIYPRHDSTSEVLSTHSKHRHRRRRHHHHDDDDGADDDDVDGRTSSAPTSSRYRRRRSCHAEGHDGTRSHHGSVRRDDGTPRRSHHHHHRHRDDDDDHGDERHTHRRRSARSTSAGPTSPRGGKEAYLMEVVSRLEQQHGTTQPPRASLVEEWLGWREGRQSGGMAAPSGSRAPSVASRDGSVASHFSRRASPLPTKSFAECGEQRPVDTPRRQSAQLRQDSQLRQRPPLIPRGY